MIARGGSDLVNALSEFLLLLDRRFLKVVDGLGAVLILDLKVRQGRARRWPVREEGHGVAVPGQETAGDGLEVEREELYRVRAGWVDNGDRKQLSELIDLDQQLRAADADLRHRRTDHHRVRGDVGNGAADE